MMGAAWIYVLDPSQMPEYLDHYGLKLIEDIGKVEFLERYFLPIGREIELMSVERVAFAEV
ncbi:hypothetical protein [Fusibacter sp. A2]|nr:hypothetical protein [Fusibacter sp. A2]